MRTAFFLGAVALGALGGTALAADEAVKAAAEPCAACHGKDGVSELEGIPSLAGQPDQFLQWQLVYFRAGTRKNEAMQPIAEALDDATIRKLGAYFAALTPPAPVEGNEDPALLKAGEAIAAQHNCGACHKESFTGQQAVARLAGQREEYLAKALEDYKSNARTGGGVAAMPTAAYRLGEQDIKALAHYLARLK